MSSTVTIAHLTDVHLGPLTGFRPRYWNLKRGLGYANWMRKRRHAHLRRVLDRIVADVMAQAPDHIAVGGDLCNIGLPQEHEAGLRWLESLGLPGLVSVVPGNHDNYCPVERDAGVQRWGAYMASDTQGAPLAGDERGFPFLRVVGGVVALIGVNSAVPTPPAMAWGRVGEEQLARLAAVLDRGSEAGLFRLVVIHHPPLPGQASAARALKDAAALKAVLARHGAELVVHGHNHINMLGWLEGASGLVPVVGAPSASMGRPYKGEPLGRYNLFRIEGTRPWGIELMGRGLAEPDGPVVEIERRQLVPRTQA
jgi:3',5'-cyclic AMP phosphodiesterase CpdA